MMTPKVRKIYLAAIKDDLFNAEILKADPTNKRPGLLAGDIDKVVFASVYYGYLVGKYGAEIVKDFE